MDAESEARHEAPAPQSAQTQQLAAAVRAAAAAAANRVGGGLALVFACGEASSEGTTRLRAAAGFPSAQAACDAAEQTSNPLLASASMFGAFAPPGKKWFK